MIAGRHKEHLNFTVHSCLEATQIDLGFYFPQYPRPVVNDLHQGLLWSGGGFEGLPVIIG